MPVTVPTVLFQGQNHCCIKVPHLLDDMRAAYSVGVVLTGRQPALHAPLQSNIAPIEELAKDLSEVDALMAASERPSVTAVLKGHRARVEQQIERQSNLIKSGDTMLRNAAHELKLERLESARISLSGARAAFSRASAHERLSQVDGIERQLSLLQDQSVEKANALSAAAGASDEASQAPTQATARGHAPVPMTHPQQSNVSSIHGRSAQLGQGAGAVS